MNTKNYDSGFCGSLPLAFINQIQSYGFLIVTDLDLKIIQVTDNVEQFLHNKMESLLDKPLYDLIQENFLSDFKTKLKIDQVKTFATVKFASSRDKNSRYLAVIHKRPEHYIFEIEMAGEKQDNFFDVYELVRTAAAAIDSAQTFDESLIIAAEELKRISGFDKVMIYKFDEYWNGHVLAEAKEPEMDSYLDLHFPASDIPKQARELYLKNPYRQIPDKDYKPGKLYPVINPIVSGFLDLSDCNLRAVPKVHVEYLTNMKVVASMSTRIIKDNKLWGLISCHHRTKKFLTYQECSVFELLSGIISSKISSMEVHDNFKHQNEKQQALPSIIENIVSETSLKNGIAQAAEQIMKILNGDGLVYSNADTIKFFGNCPDKEGVEKLLIWLQTKSLTQVFYTSSLSEYFDEAESMKKNASGIIAVPIVPSNREFVVLFRKELQHEISWGGNPEDAIRFEADKSSYHPRNSFDQWQQQVKNTSLAFSQNELFFANELQRIILGFRLSQTKNN